MSLFLTCKPHHYVRGKCITQWATVSYFRNYQKKNCKEVKAKWRTYPVGGQAPVSPMFYNVYIKELMCHGN